MQGDMGLAPGDQRLGVQVVVPRHAAADEAVGQALLVGGEAVAQHRQQRGAGRGAVCAEPLDRAGRAAVDAQALADHVAGDAAAGFGADGVQFLHERGVEGVERGEARGRIEDHFADQPVIVHEAGKFLLAAQHGERQGVLGQQPGIGADALDRGFDMGDMAGIVAGADQGLPGAAHGVAVGGVEAVCLGEGAVGLVMAVEGAQREAERGVAARQGRVEGDGAGGMGQRLVDHVPRHLYLGEALPGAGVVGRGGAMLAPDRERAGLVAVPGTDVGQPRGGGGIGRIAPERGLEKPGHDPAVGDGGAGRDLVHGGSVNVDAVRGQVYA